MLGPGKPIDSDRWFVICVNSLGSCKGSTGPASINPDTGEPYRLAFPDLSIEDIADAAHEVVRALGIERLACVIGNSMGGMTALAYLLLHPGHRARHINISGSARALPFSIAIRSLQREAIRLDPAWNHGNYDDEHYPENGMRMARKLGVVTYRSAMEWDGRFGRVRLDQRVPRRDDPFGLEFEVERYLEGHARRFVRQFDPNCYLYLSRSMDWFDLAEYAERRRDWRALARIRVAKCARDRRAHRHPVSRCSSRSRSPTACAPAAPTSEFVAAGLAAGPRCLPGRHRPVRPGHRRIPGAVVDYRHELSRTSAVATRCWRSSMPPMPRATTRPLTHSLRDGLCRLIRERAVSLPDCVFEPVEGHYARRELYRQPRARHQRRRDDLGARAKARRSTTTAACGASKASGTASSRSPATSSRKKTASAAASASTRPCIAGTGSAGSLMPPHEYHTIRNPQPDPVSISLHVYQRAMGTCATFEPIGDDWYQRGSKSLCLDQVDCDG